MGAELAAEQRAARGVRATNLRAILSEEFGGATRTRRKHHTAIRKGCFLA